MTRVMVPTTGTRRYNDHLHIDFFLGAFRGAGFDVVLYGPGADARGNAPIPFDKSRPIGEVARELKPDLYFTLAPKRSQWASHHRVGLDIPKVIYHCDLHYAKDAVDYRASLIVVRAKAHLAHLRSLPHGASAATARWLPFSVDTSRVPLHLTPSTQRRARVFFAGAADPQFYPLRAEAIDALQRAKLLARDGFRGFEDYVAGIGEHAIGLTCSSRWHLDVAKHVELAVAGALVLTDGRAEGLADIFPDPMMYANYEDGPSAVTRARRLLGDRDELARRARLAQAHVLARHSDVVRGSQFISMLKEARCC